MTAWLFAIGSGVAVGLVGSLIATLYFTKFRLWPTPGAGTWQSYLFWSLFRSLNVLCFAVAIADRTAFHGLHWSVRLLAFGLLAVSLALFIYAFRVLGRDKSYCAADGLVTSGIYKWSRNPQNALLMVVYACLALAADGARAYVLCAAMIAAYGLMVRAEEPWLEAAYGAAYKRYCRRVPRFFNWRRAWVYVHATIGSPALATSRQRGHQITP